ncbi:STAS domain-containing protein [Geomesophilobacter sediminis]|uniref:STAS domain-containing protein n=1 Tax=Geomesophilobacter sediminis TaxID=2798584 RepID=A0A8J7M0H9_9BACT|nr:STAS domain-containing protein [Geomesophilobacter sediminis]MBJ6725277.1 STAS domain-containing protein [Geomesophilobacter sediminis]
MVAYTISSARNYDSSLRTTLHIEGAVTVADWERLRELLIDVLKNSEQLVLNIENVSEFDDSFNVLVCLLRRTVQLLSKRLTIVGKAADTFSCIYEAALHSDKHACSYATTSSCCIWDNLFTNSPYTLKQ